MSKIAKFNSLTPIPGVMRHLGILRDLVSTCPQNKDLGSLWHHHWVLWLKEGSPSRHSADVSHQVSATLKQMSSIHVHNVSAPCPSRVSPDLGTQTKKQQSHHSGEFAGLWFWYKFQCGFAWGRGSLHQKTMPWMPAVCPRIKLNSDTIYSEAASDFTG